MNKIRFLSKIAEKIIELLNKEFGFQMSFQSPNRQQPIQENLAEEEQEIKKVRSRIDNWFLNRRQYNSKILYAFIKLHKENNGIVTYDSLKKESRLGTFKSNYDQMKNFGDKNHGKIFEQNGENIYLWKKVEGIVWDTYEKYSNKFEPL